MQGKIVKWNDQKGYGFIDVELRKELVFFHITALKNSNIRPKLNESVSFAIERDAQGRLSASGVVMVNQKGSVLPFSILFSLFFLSVVAASVLFLHTPLPVMFVYLALSLVTFVIYAKDKHAAKKGKWRTKESTLHFFALIGGWPGALLAQHKLHHKSRKQPFKCILWFTILSNCTAFAWTLTPTGVFYIDLFLL